MSKKHQMINSVIVAIKNNRDGSYRTQADRRQALIQMAEDLYSLGYKLDHLRFMKPKHIQALVAHWQAKEDTPGCMKNRMSHLRWLMRKFEDKIHMVPSNDALGIPKRTYIAKTDQSITLTEADLNQIKDPLMRHSLKGQELFGLRVETSLKLKPFIADAGQYLYIQKGWAKGGRECMVPILTQEQRDWLDEAKRLVQHQQNSLIPPSVSYKTYRYRFNQACHRAGIQHRHGLRHLYAQKRYQALTGWAPPVKGGPKKQTMTTAQKSMDHATRLQVSFELGHSRSNILGQYIG